MVSVAGNGLLYWLLRRRLMANALLAGNAIDMTFADMGPLVIRYRRAQREVALLLERSRRIRGTTFNLNAFSSE